MGQLFNISTDVLLWSLVRFICYIIYFVWVVAYNDQIMRARIYSNWPFPQIYIKLNTRQKNYT